jgi:hypothetical protein
VENSSHSVCFGKFRLDLELLSLLLLMLLFVSILVFVLLSLSFDPISRLAPQTTELMVVPMMLEARLRCPLELLEGAVLCPSFVLYASETNCWDCMHDPCARNPPLEWDEVEKVYCRFFSCDGKTKKNIWMKKSIGTMATINFKQGEKKRKERMEKDREEETCAGNQKTAQMYGHCCHQHEKVAKTEHKEKKRQKKKRKDEVNKVVDGPDHCIHCDEDPCAFIQIESRLCENHEIYCNKDDYAKDPVACNSGRRKRAYQYAAFVMWEGINYQKPHYRCFENGVRALFPAFDGKIMCYKSS